MKNKVKFYFSSLSSNEAFARNVIASFILPLNPTISEITDIKTAVSEAVTNSIVHGYPDSVGDIEISAEIDGQDVHIEISDDGVGIDDLQKALEPFYSTKIESERSGMGFTIMKTFMDEVTVISAKNSGTKVRMCKKINCENAQ